jgi:cytochrome c oxidase subunit IV
MKSMHPDGHSAEFPLEAGNADSMESVRNSLRLYVIIGAALFIGTVATTAVATLPTLDLGGHGFDKWDAILGVAIAASKASLVAAVFMHLNHERPWVYALITLATIHAIGLFIGTYMHFADMTSDGYFYRNDRDAMNPGTLSVHQDGAADATP